MIKNAAAQYSGAGQSKPLPMVLATVTGAIDRGACIKDLSQYPAEVAACACARARGDLHRPALVPRLQVNVRA